MVCAFHHSKQTYDPRLKMLCHILFQASACAAVGVTVNTHSVCAILRKMAIIYDTSKTARTAGDRHGRSSRGGISGMPCANSFASTGEACYYVFLCSCTVMVGTCWHRVVQCAKPKACRGAGHGLMRLPHKNLASDQRCSADHWLLSTGPSNTAQTQVKHNPMASSRARPGLQHVHASS